jgi:hypothetical protein
MNRSALVVDLLIEFIYNGATSLSGYMLGAKVLGLPEPAAILLAALMGFIGMANHWRALRKTSAVLVLALMLGACSSIPLLHDAQMDLAKFTTEDLDAAILAAEDATDEGAIYRLRCYRTLKDFATPGLPPKTVVIKGLASAYEQAAQLDAKLRSGVSLIPAAVKADCAYIETQLLRFTVRTGAKFAPIPGASAIGGVLR